MEKLPVAQARAGDPAAWDTLFRRYQLPLYTFVYDRTHDDAGSLDILQETFIAAVKHLGNLREDHRFGSWLFGIAHQKVIQRWRKRTEDGVEQLPEPTEAWEDSPADLLIRQEQSVEFLALVDQLPPPQRSVLLLHYLEDFSLAEIAEITETELGTVKSRLHYAKKSLRRILEVKDEDPA